MATGGKPKDFGDKLRKAAKRSKRSGYDLAKCTGLSEATLSRFMRGEQSLRLDRADKLAAYFGLMLRKDR